MKHFISLLILLHTVVYAHGLVINEILSNPVGDDGGREWIEIYNGTDSSVDLTSLSISIKGGAFVPVTSVSGGTLVGPYGYAIIGATVGGVTKFALEYPTFIGPLFKSSISLVNTGVTSLELKVAGAVVDTLSSYTAAKEGSSYSLVGGTFVTGTPTPGEENKQLVTEDVTPTTTTPSGTQMTLAQASPPATDITIYLPKEKIVVAGAPALFSVFSLTQAGKAIENMTYVWGFGDGGSGTGSSTLYRYFYPGRYVAQVEGTNGLIAGSGRMIVRVVSPDISISSIGNGKYGNYIDITNPNDYDLDISLWKISIDGVPFSFPKNTLLSQGKTRFSGAALGFASTTISSSTIIRLLFQNMDEVIRITQGGSTFSMEETLPTKTTIRTVTANTFIPPTAATVARLVRIATNTPISLQASTSKKFVRNEQKDTRLATFFKSLFSR